MTFSPEERRLRILYIGSLNKRSNSFRRYRTLEKLGCQLDGIDTDPYLHMGIFAGLHYHFSQGPGVFSLNRKVISTVRKSAYDIVWVDNKPYLNKCTLKLIKKQQPGARIINLLTDDPNGKFRRSWGLIRKTASLYDDFFVQRLTNIQELKSWGAPRVRICYRSFDPDFHRPIILNEQDKCFKTQVGFIGTYEDVRAEYIADLIKKGIPVTVVGDGWEGGIGWDLIKPYYRGPSVYGEAYIKHINGMDIALHFLRHANRDEQDSRTFEIPACKVFMVAERTTLHKQLFEEDKEAVFFDNREELAEKVKYYLSHPELRAEIAANGYEACYRKGYYHSERLKSVLTEIFS